tara:strand:- start:1127 stop:1915 length:789 start_codon:yes stop_codon:yes gene_type:complete
MNTKSKKSPSLPSNLYSEEYFLSSCEGYTEFTATNGSELSVRLEKALDYACIQSGMKILDIGCGRGEMINACSDLGANAVGIDYADAAISLTKSLKTNQKVSLSDAKSLPFPNNFFDRVLILDVVEHLYPWELNKVLKQIFRVLSPEGQLIVHTAPNVWYDRYAYPIVRIIRKISGKGALYPKNPRGLNVAANLDVHVNEQSALSLWLALYKSGFVSKVWLDSPIQNRSESLFLSFIRKVLFGLPPFRWFFQREIFAVAKRK